MTKVDPVSILKSQAEAQRHKLHHDIVELRSTVRETLNAKKLARQYFWPASGVAALVGLLLGYSVTGIFTKDQPRISR
jgi:hypothetical protein